MAAPVYATDLTDFWVTGGTTTVTAIGTGGAGLGNPETDFFIQSTSCVSKAAWTNATKGFIIDGVAGNFTVPTDGAVIAFMKYDAAGSLDTKANGGLQMIIGSTSSAYYHFYVGGKTTLAFDSWIPYTVDPNTATADNTTGSPGTNERWVGVLATLPTTSGPTKGNPIAMDAIRYGRCRIDYTVGDSGTPATFAGAEAYGNDVSRRWGLLELLKGAYQTQGFHSIGTSGTACYFSDANRVIFIRPSGANNVSNDSVSNAFNRFEIINASTTCIWDNILFQALGTRARGRFYHTAGTFTVTNCQFVNTGLMSLLSTSSLTNCIMRSSGVITAPGSTLNGTKILTNRAGTNLSALVWDVATDADGKLDNMEFSKGTNAHHAITFGTSSPTTITMRGADFTGFSSSNDNDASVFKFLRTSGNVTLNLIGCTHDGSGFTIDDRAGCTVTVVIDPVTTSVNVKDRNKNNIQNARVFVETAATATGGEMFEAAVTSLTQSAGTATCTMTAPHKLATNDYVVIRGAQPDGYNKVAQVTVSSTTVFTYTVPSGIAGTATGTPVVSLVPLYGLTDASGNISSSKTWGIAQDLKGWARKKNTSSPFYKDADIAYTVNITAGNTTNVVLQPDE